MNTLLNSSNLGASWIDEAECLAVQEVLQCRELFRFGGQSPKSLNALFEEELARRMNASAAATFSSGTAALKAGLVALGVRSGDRVLVSAYTFVASAAAVHALGANPVPIDLDEQLGMDCDDLLRHLPGARVVMPVYAPGYASNTRKVTALAKAHGAAVIEDASQALGVTVDGTATGLIGDLGVYSFQQGKQLACGEGGAIVSQSSVITKSAARYADHGAVRDDGAWPEWNSEEATLGENFRLSELQAAVLRVQLMKLDDMLMTQRALRQRILDEANAQGRRVVQSHDPHGDSGAMLYLLAESFEQAQSAIALARSRGLLMRSIWPRLFCDLDAFQRQTKSRPPERLRARELAKRLVALPVPPMRDLERQELFVQRVKELFHRHDAQWR